MHVGCRALLALFVFWWRERLQYLFRQKLVDLAVPRNGLGSSGFRVVLDVALRSMAEQYASELFELRD
jgi:hypothetical protein